MKRLVLTFPDSEARAAFVGWFLDGGGDQAFAESQATHNEPPLYSSTPGGEKTWDWQRLGHEADEHVIEMQPEEG